jgi:hypothetical protein
MHNAYKKKEVLYTFLQYYISVYINIYINMNKHLETAYENIYIIKWLAITHLRKL